MLFKIVKFVGILVGVTAFTFFVFLLFMILVEYRPKAVEAVRVKPLSVKTVLRKIAPGEPLTLTTYNIGYAGLDQGRDFFMDGGRYSRSESLEKTKENLKAIEDFLISVPSDFYMLQEVDEKAYRSYDINEVEELANALSEYDSAFAYNYKVKWVPVPWNDPMGGVKAGLMTLLSRQSAAHTRYSLPGDEPVPKRYFDLKRCVLESVLPVSNGKKLYLINLHLSAFDKGGMIRAKQVKWLEEHIAELYKNGDYVILAGDWNHLLSKKFMESYQGELPAWVALLPESMLKMDFTLAVDDSVHTIRSTKTPYTKGKSFETIIDGFFVSNNIEVVKTTGHDLGFVHTDHNPVTLEFRLK